MQRRPSTEHRDRLINRVSAVGQLSALVAMASTGITAGVLAHDARVKDLAAAQARQQAAPPPVPAPVQVRLVPRPVRTVLVRVAAPKRATAVRRTATRSAPTVVRAAPKQVVHVAPRPVAKPAAQPAATTSTGS